MTISQIIGRIKIKDGVAINNIMGTMNKSVGPYGKNSGSQKQRDPAANLWDALRDIVENENGDHGDSEDEDDEYSDFDINYIDIYTRHLNTTPRSKLEA
mmetsp:Transcript_21346/g.26268  ORF Transcript_21346/g.26268 Transcript_21346/m.26268 type:complete len:99 (+) Transcript_21346:505-801(+)